MHCSVDVAPAQPRLSRHLVTSWAVLSHAPAPAPHAHAFLLSPLAGSVSGLTSDLCLSALPAGWLPQMCRENSEQLHEHLGYAVCAWRRRAARELQLHEISTHILRRQTQTSGGQFGRHMAAATVATVASAHAHAHAADIRRRV